jgi:hypothetical protein
MANDDAFEKMITERRNAIKEEMEDCDSDNYGSGTDMFQGKSIPIGGETGFCLLDPEHLVKKADVIKTTLTLPELYAMRSGPICRKVIEYLLVHTADGECLHPIYWRLNWKKVKKADPSATCICSAHIYTKEKNA